MSHNKHNNKVVNKNLHNYHFGKAQKPFLKWSFRLP